MTLALLSSGPLDERARMDVEAYRQAFGAVEVLEPDASWSRLRHAKAIRVMSFTACLPAVYARLRWGIPYVLQYGYDYDAVARANGQNKRLRYGILRRLAIPRAAGVIVTNRQLGNRLGSYSEVPTMVIPNGVDLLRFFPISLRTDAMRLLYIGRLAPEKNLVRLAEAVRSLDLRLSVYGQGPEARAIVAAGGGRVAMCGHLAYSRVPEVMQSHDVFCLPSLTEGSPKALFEAMAVGLPCVASETIPLDDELSGKPVVVRCDPMSAMRIRDGIMDALSSRQIGRDARAYVKRYHDWEMTMQAEVEFVRKMTGL